MARCEDNIVNCARRLVEKLKKGECVKFNGEYLKPVRDEIAKMVEHCGKMK